MIDFTQVLTAVGEFGPFQKRLLGTICLPNIFSAFHMFGQVFMGLTHPHTCNTDWIRDRGPNLTLEEQLNLTVPSDPAVAGGGYERCVMFTPVDLGLEDIKAYGLNATVACTDGWAYQVPPGTSTLITEVTPFVSSDLYFRG